MKEGMLSGREIRAEGGKISRLCKKQLSSQSFQFEVCARRLPSKR